MEFDRALAELETLVETLEREGDERALLLLQLVDAIHRPALEALAEGDHEHPLAQALLGMYGLVPVDDAVLVEEALDDVRPYIHSHGGSVELLGVEDGVVRLRLAGACVGCAGSALTLKRGIEGALRERYPGFKEIAAEEAPAPLLQIGTLKRPVFADAGAADEVEPGALKAVAADGDSVLLASVEGDIYAFRNACALDGSPLDGGRLAGNVIVCPWHNCAYDARTGTRVDDASQPRLVPLPVALRDGTVQVAVNVA